MSNAEPSLSSSSEDEMHKLFSAKAYRASSIGEITIALDAIRSDQRNGLWPTLFTTVSCTGCEIPNIADRFSFALGEGSSPRLIDAEWSGMMAER